MARLESYDVIILGAGPAGIFAAIELCNKSDLQVLILEKGKDISKRIRTKDSILCGWGGAGAFSDGKLTFSTETGGWLKDYVGKKMLKKLMQEVDETYLRFNAPNTIYGDDDDAIAEISRKAAKVELRLIPSRIRHLGTDLCTQLLKKMRQEIDGKAEVIFEKPVSNLLVQGDKVKGVRTDDGEEILAKYVLVAPGRGGADWLRREAFRLGLRTTNNPVDIGLRIEVPAAVMNNLTDVLYEPKFVYYSKSFDDKVRTFCVCPQGFVVTERLDDIITVNGHSYKSKKSENTNFAILASTSFTEPFKEPVAYGKYVAKLANLLVGGVIVQRLGDLEVGRRSTLERLNRSIVKPTLKDINPGDLSFALPGRYLSDVKEMLSALDKISPGIYSRHTLLYGVEVKFYSSRLELNRVLETKIRNLFTAGDGAGITRGLVQSSTSGLIVAKEILKRTSNISI
ncbi:MAG: NAD(P)/FAD-dependent oxidoreductase [Candidatus Methylarchaceae archaeon HK02M2]|nr:NAD(P)/FAD-dependent oxidoreductase [Candidatus Methylarchaceae archaeon HK02M2]